jgi:thiosulfate/3-mercaptopyruvate sulfurtransferase
MENDQSMSESQVAQARVDPEWWSAHMNDPNVCLIEVAGLQPQDAEAYLAGHVPGAHSWKWQEMLWDSHRRDFPSPEEFARRMGAAGIGNDTTVVFYGEGLQFGVYAWWVFRYCGHERVRVLDGGRKRWVSEGRALVKEAPAPRPPARYSPGGRNESMRILRDDVLRALDAPQTLLLDARSPEEYRGERVSAPGGPDHGAIRYGRIPGAQHLYFEDLLRADGSFKAPEELAPLVEHRGVSQDKDIIVYCRLSHRATVLYFALTQLLGFSRVRVYDGSWTEWGNLVGAPVER